MNCRNIIFLSVLYVFLPAWIGFFWVELLQIAGRWNRFLHAWTLGFTTMLAAAQAVLVPLVATKQTLTSAMILWQMILNVLALISFWRVLKCWKQRGLAAGTADTATAVPSKTERSAGGARAWTFTFGVLAAVLILLQAYIPARYEHRDDDDSRFVSEEVSAVEHDTMYQDDPIAGDFLYWNEGEVKKDFTSPWAMYVAIGSRLSGIPPAVLSHTYLPFFLILLCYAVYFLIGQVLLRGVFVFDLFVGDSSVGLHLHAHAGVHAAFAYLAGKGGVRELYAADVVLSPVSDHAAGVQKELDCAAFCGGCGGMPAVGDRNCNCAGCHFLVRSGRFYLSPGVEKNGGHLGGCTAEHPLPAVLYGWIGGT